MKTSRERMPIRDKQNMVSEVSEKTKTLARNLLEQKEFKDYEEALHRETMDFIEWVKQYRNPDPLAYAFVIQGRIKEFATLDSILQRVIKDAGVSNEDK